MVCPSHNQQVSLSTLKSLPNPTLKRAKARSPLAMLGIRCKMDTPDEIARDQWYSELVDEVSNRLLTNLRLIACALIT